MTLLQIRHDVAEILHLAPADIGEDENLFDLGLDSMRMMTLVLKWQETGVMLDFATYAENPTLRAWQTAIAAHSA